MTEAERLAALLATPHENIGVITGKTIGDMIEVNADYVGERIHVVMHKAGAPHPLAFKFNADNGRALGELLQQAAAKVKERKASQ
jgi:hypothetical protein